ncbi:NAD(P)-dependent oxidoreductase, partial [candidate division WOR-3 bacterium]|nr:NAD(P)-dependent oxidoreductase [candidate division WOR-3 bacterium]
MKVLITGGSGFLGINLIRYLLDRGINDIISLDLVEFDYPEKNKIRALVGDIRNKETVKQLMKDVTFVIHCAAALPLYSKEEIFSTDVEGTKIVLKEAFKNNVERFIHISTTAVYGIPDHHPLYEDDRLEGVGPYGEAKILAEEACLEYRDKGMCIPILRPK